MTDREDTWLRNDGPKDDFIVRWLQVSDIVDRNEDNIITTAEVVVGFADILGYQCKQAIFYVILFEQSIFVLTCSLASSTSDASSHVWSKSYLYRAVWTSFTEPYVFNWHAMAGNLLNLSKARYTSTTTKHEQEEKQKQKKKNIPSPKKTTTTKYIKHVWNTG